MEHGGIGRRVGRRRADRTLGWPWTGKLADARLSNGMETSLACSSAAAALFAASFFSSPPCHAFQSAGAPYPPPTPRLSCPAASLWEPAPRLRRAIVGDPLRRHGGAREEEELQLWRISAGKMGIYGAF
jgi:hypothetical protein